MSSDTFAIAEVLSEERSSLPCDIAGNGMFCELRQRAREMRCLGESKQTQYIEPILVLQAILSVRALSDLVQLGDQ